MALSLGSLFVKLNADSTNLNKGLEGAGQKIAQFGKKVESVTSKLGGIGLAMSAFGANAVRIGAQLDSGVGTAVAQVQGAFNALNTEIARALLPVIQKMAQVIQTVADAFKRLSPEQKEFIAQVGAAVATGLTLIATLGKIVAAVTSLAPVFQAVMGAVTGALAWPLAALAAIAAALPLLAVAWEENWGGIADTVKGVVDWMMGAWGKFTDWFASKTSGLGKAFKAVFDWLLARYMEYLSAMADGVAYIADVFGIDIKNSVNAFKETVKDIGDRGFDGLVEDAKAGASMMVSAYSRGIDIIKSKAKSMLPDFKLSGLGGIAMPGMTGPAAPPSSDLMAAFKANEKVVLTTKKLQAAFDELATQAVYVPSGLMKEISQSFAEALRTQDWDVAEQVIDNLKKLSKGFEDEARARELAAAEAKAKSRAALEGIGQTIANQFGEMMDIINLGIQGAQAGMAAGPVGGAVGAILGIVVGVLMKSKQFQKLVLLTGEFIANVADAFGELLSPLVSLGVFIMQEAIPGFKLLKEVFKVVAVVLKVVLTVLAGAFFGIYSIWNGFAAVINMVVEVIAAAVSLFNKDAAQQMRDFARGLFVDTGGMFQRTMDALWGPATDFAAEGMGVMGEAAFSAAAGLDSLNGAIGNAPRGFKMAGYKFNLGEPVGDFTPLQINISVDGKEMQARVLEVNRRGYFVQTGGFLPPRP